MNLGFLNGPGDAKGSSADHRTATFHHLHLFRYILVAVRENLIANIRLPRKTRKNRIEVTSACAAFSCISSLSWFQNEFSLPEQAGRCEGLFSGSQNYNFPPSAFVSRFFRRRTGTLDCKHRLTTKDTKHTKESHRSGVGAPRLFVCFVSFVVAKWIWAFLDWPGAAQGSFPGP